MVLIAKGTICTTVKGVHLLFCVKLSKISNNFIFIFSKFDATEIGLFKGLLLTHSIITRKIKYNVFEYAE